MDEMTHTHTLTQTHVLYTHERKKNGIDLRHFI